MSTPTQHLLDFLQRELADYIAPRGASAVVPMNDERVAKMATVISMANTLHPSAVDQRFQPELQYCLKVISHSVQIFRARGDKERRLFSPEPLRVLPTTNKNPVAALADILRQSDPFTPQQIEKAILDVLRNHAVAEGYANPNHIAEAIGLPVSTVLSSLRLLVKEGSLKQSNAGFKITDEGRRRSFMDTLDRDRRSGSVVNNIAGDVRNLAIVTGGMPTLLRK